MRGGYVRRRRIDRKDISRSLGVEGVNPVPVPQSPTAFLHFRRQKLLREIRYLARCFGHFSGQEVPLSPGSVKRPKTALFAGAFQVRGEVGSRFRGCYARRRTNGWLVRQGRRDRSPRPPAYGAG